MDKRKILDIDDAYYFATYRTRSCAAIFSNSIYADILLDTLTWLRVKQRIYLVAFVIMPTHIHYIFKPRPNNTPTKISHSFGSFTAHKIVEACKDKDPNYYGIFRQKGEITATVWDSRFIKTITHYCPVKV